MLSEIIISQK